MHLLSDPCFVATSPILFYRVAYVLMALIALELIRGSVLEIWRG
jgi:hypothetical protein